MIRAEGFTQEGIWHISGPYPAESEGYPSLELQLLGSGSFYDWITFHDDPDAIGIPYAKFHYFRGTGDDPAPGIPAGLTEWPCGHPVGPVVPQSAAEVEELLLGTWTVCQPDGVTGLLGPEVVTIEFAADGRYRTLVRAAGGSVRRDPDLPEATWTVDHEPGFVTHFEPPLVIIASNGSEQYINPIFLSEQAVLSFDWSVGGLLTRTPPASEAPLPATGSSTTMVAIAGSVLIAGFSVLVLTRFRYR